MPETPLERSDPAAQQKFLQFWCDKSTVINNSMSRATVYIVRDAHNYPVSYSVVDTHHDHIIITTVSEHIAEYWCAQCNNSGSPNKFTIPLSEWKHRDYSID